MRGRVRHSFGRCRARVKERSLRSTRPTEDDVTETAHDNGTTPLRPVSDLAGMPVEDAAGHNIGELFGTLAEAATGLLRYFDLALYGRSRHVLVPVGHARIERRLDAPHVRLRAATLDELEDIPPYHADPSAIDDPYERALLHAYGRSFHGERYYAHPAYDHSGLYAGDHLLLHDDGTTGHTALQPLGDLHGAAFTDGVADVRGWPLMAGSGEHAGAVADAIADRAARVIRYVVVERRDGTRRIVPVGFLRLDPDERVVRAPGLHDADVEALPAYEGGAPARELEEAVRRTLEQRVSDRRRYDMPDFAYVAPPRD
jgi:hypothetical protein